MKLRWTRLALADFLEAQDYIAQENPLAAQAMAQRIDEAVRGLLDHPRIGRSGQVEGTRELVISRTPYLIIYRLRGDDIELLRVWHGRQDWHS